MAELRRRYRPPYRNPIACLQRMVVCRAAPAVDLNTPARQQLLERIAALARKGPLQKALQRIGLTHRKCQIGFYFMVKVFHTAIVT